jgi:hypothetical protein
MEIKILKLTESVLEHLDSIIAHHPFYVIQGLVCLWMIFMVWVIVDVARRKSRGQLGRVPPVIIVESTVPPPPPKETFDPFPPPHHIAHCDCHDDWD